MFRLLRSHHPFRLLLYLEWILLGIALLTLFVPFPRHSFFWPHMAPGRGLKFPFGVLLSILILGSFGFKLPIHRSQIVKWGYTGLGMLLCWATVVMGGRFREYFIPLLLIVVIRACLLFPWKQRLVIASLAYGSFLLRLITGVQHVRPVRLSRRLGPPPPWRHDLSQDLLASFQLRSALLFGLVLIFILLMVGALLTEHQSRSDLAAANHRLRQYALMIENQATLQERTRIAREMHDSVGHALTAQSIQLENVDLWMPQDQAKATAHLQTARSLGKDALQSVRQTVAALRHHPLQGLSLSQALRKLTQDFERTTSIQVKLTIRLETPVLKEVTAAIYRLVQEALTNVSKHSEATQVTVEVLEQEKGLTLSIADNGKGFLPAQNTTGFGLQGMQERTEALGGLFELGSAPQTGCHIQIKIPRLGE